MYDETSKELVPDPPYALIHSIALLMAIGASAWGLSIHFGRMRHGFPFLDERDLQTKFLLIGAVYVMTIGYWYRAFFCPKYRFRVAIWTLSFLVQGGFSVYAIWCLLNLEIWFHRHTFVCLAWWWSATVVSILVGRMEPPDVEADSK